jgi:hypothetical protein
MGYASIWAHPCPMKTLAGGPDKAMFRSHLSDCYSGCHNGSDVLDLGERPV